MKNLNDINDWLDINEHQKIGEILVQSGKVSLHDLGVALDIQTFEEIQLGYILLKMNVISQDDLDCALSLQNRIDERLEREME